MPLQDVPCRKLPEAVFSAVRRTSDLCFSQLGHANAAQKCNWQRKGFSVFSHKAPDMTPGLYKARPRLVVATKHSCLGSAFFSPFLFCRLLLRHLWEKPWGPHCLHRKPREPPGDCEETSRNPFQRTRCERASAQVVPLQDAPCRKLPEGSTFCRFLQPFVELQTFVFHNLTVQMRLKNAIGRGKDSQFLVTGHSWYDALGLYKARPRLVNSFSAANICLRSPWWSWLKQPHLQL